MSDVTALESNGDVGVDNCSFNVFTADSGVTVEVASASIANSMTTEPADTPNQRIRDALIPSVAARELMKSTLYASVIALISRPSLRVVVTDCDNVAIPIVFNPDVVPTLVEMNNGTTSPGLIVARLHVICVEVYTSPDAQMPRTA